MTEFPNSPDDWQELLAGYVLGNLSPEELIQFNQYLAQNPESQHEVARLQKTLALLPLSLVEEQAPKNLKARIRASAYSAMEESELLNATFSTAKNNKRKFQKLLKSKIKAGIALMAIAILGWQTYHLKQQVNLAESQVETLLQAKAESETARTNFVRYRETVSLLYQPKNRLLNLTGFESSVRASGSLLISPDRKIAVLVLQNIPNPPPGKIYQMWAVVNGQKINCTQFRPDRDGTVLLQMPVTNWIATPMVTITVEPEGVTSKPSNNMVMSSPQIL
jgi:anti-sigma-K factor RskA